MTPDRWKQIEQLYHSALALEVDKRAAFLVRAAAGDEELRREVESLLGQAGSRGGILDRSAWQGARDSVAPGTQLGPYRIEALFGVALRYGIEIADALAEAHGRASSTAI